VDTYLLGQAGFEKQDGTAGRLQMACLPTQLARATQTVAPSGP
jgi:hypothetical protein